MKRQSLETPSIVPHVSLVINLSAASGSAASSEKKRLLASQLSELGLSATWVIDQSRDVEGLGGGPLAKTRQEVALTADARSPQRLRSELSRRQAAISEASGHVVTAVFGDPLQLRARTTLLADLGITAVVANCPDTDMKTPRPLPSGLWQVEPTLTIPQPRRWGLLPVRRIKAARISASAAINQPAVISIALDQLTARELQACDVLFQEIGESQQQGLLAAVTVSELALQTASRYEVKPQRSILRRAA